MRLQEIHIHSYRVLHNFTLEFDDTVAQAVGDTYALDLLVGVNGTGKSSLLHALADIFQSLYRGEKPKFGFRLRYQLHAQSESIIISNLDDDGEPLLGEPSRLWLDSVEVTPAGPVDYRYLPAWVIAFTSGSEKGWELAESQHVEDQENGPPDVQEQLKNWYLSEQMGKPVVESQAIQQPRLEINYLFISADLIPLVVLCGLLQDMSQQGTEHPPEFVSWALKECKLKGLCGFSLKFRMHRELLDPLDHAFITNLAEKAHHTIQRGSEYLLVFSLENDDRPFSEQATGVVKPRDVFAIEGTCINFFKKLVNLQKPASGTPSILREVNLFFAGNRQQQGAEAEPSQSPLLLFDWLSDGEQSLLGRLCLFALFEADTPYDNAEANERNRASEALILLDEPEVHFNDYWKRQLVRMLSNALQGTPRHVLMTTHSSITLSDVADDNIWILRRENGYTEHADPPNIRTLGADPSDILVSVFSAENAVGAQSVEQIRQTLKNARELFSEKPETSREMLHELLVKLGPGYWRYLVRREIDAMEAQ